MKKKVMFVLTLLVLCVTFAQGAQQGFLWWNVEGDTTLSPASILVPTTGISKALVLVIEFPDYDSNYVDDDTIYPTFYKYLIAPHIDTALNDTMYKWSITNFLYTASLGKDTVIGGVNPGFNGRYIIAPESLSYYQRSGGVDELEEDIIAVADSGVG